MNPSNTTQGITTSSGINIPFTIPANDRLLIVAAAVRIGHLNAAPTCTKNGASVPLIPLFTPQSFATNQLGAYYILNPDPDPQLISPGHTGIDLAYAIASYGGISQSPPPDNDDDSNLSASGFSVTSTLTPIADNCWTILIAYGNNQGGGDPSAGAGSTFRAGGGTNNFVKIFDSNGPIHPAAPYSMTVSQASSNNLPCYIVSFAPAIQLPQNFNALNLIQD